MGATFRSGRKHVGARAHGRSYAPEEVPLGDNGKQPGLP
jgi:hypothetical protein